MDIDLTQLRVEENHADRHGTVTSSICCIQEFLGSYKERDLQPCLQSTPSIRLGSVVYA